MKLRIVLLSALLWCSLEATVDTIIFSKDRPMQLYALLESMHLHMKGMGRIFVLCHTKNDDFHRGYAHVQACFPQVSFVFQRRENPRHDFLPLLKNIVQVCSSNVLMFAVDDIIVTDHVNLDQCAEILLRRAAYGFYLRLGCDIQYCYTANKPSPQPQCTVLGHDVLEWDLTRGAVEWGYQHTVDMTLYPRETIERCLTRCHASSPNTFEGAWACVPAPKNARGLCYSTSRLINNPCNLVQQDWHNRHMKQSYTVEQLLELFVQGYRIDVRALIRYPHNAPHVEVPLPFRIEQER